jgi:hypothetical protein
MDIKDAAMQVMRVIEGGASSDDSGYILLDYLDATQQAAAFIIKRDFWKDTNATGETQINYTYLEIFEDVEVLYNEKTDRYYVPLPVDVIALPQDYGVQYVSERQNLTDPYSRTSIGTIGLYSNLPDDISSWFLTNKNIVLVNFDSGVKYLTLGLIPSVPSVIGDDDLVEIIQLVKERFLKGKVAQDKVNNSNPNE